MSLSLLANALALVVASVENAPTAFLKLLKGDNFGKMLVKLR